MISVVEKGTYLLLGLEPERVLSTLLFVASHLIAPVCVSYWSGFYFYTRTEQVLLSTFLPTTTKKRATMCGRLY